MFNINNRLWFKYGCWTLIYKFMDSNQISNILDSFNIKDYTLNKDGSVNLLKDVSFFRKGIDKIPFKIKKAYGTVDFSFNNLTDLIGSPEEALSVYYAMNNITDLTGITMRSKLISLSNNKIEKLNLPDGFNTGELVLSNNEIYDLKGIPNSFNGKIILRGNPIENCFKINDGSDVKAFNSLKIINDKTVNIKRLKYFYDIINKSIKLDINEIEKYYKVI